MSKRSQLDRLKKGKFPSPDFIAFSWNDYQKGVAPKVQHLSEPLVVRSTFSEEDGDQESKAGHFTTVLHVKKTELKAAIQKVFDSYPSQEGQEVIIQQMIQPLFSGVLFAYRNGVWKMEINEGLGEQVVSGQVNAKRIILPRFGKMDFRMSRISKFWQIDLDASPVVQRALVQLSHFTTRLLSDFKEAQNGLDIEFSITEKGLYLLQARPITTPDDEEQVLTSANHKEILPPQPSPFMTSIISSAGQELFAFYRNLDPSLADHHFLVESAGMPWINLSALLDTMVHWGLPTSLVAKSVGAVDFYQVKFRFWRFVSKIPVFLRLQKQQSGVQAKIRDWVKKQRVLKRLARNERELLWENNPEEALKHWMNDFRSFYIELVTYMQLLTGAMSGPVSIANRLGILSKKAAQLKQNSASTDYLHAFQDLKSGLSSKESFLRKFGHRGFYESDIGQKRFWEYSDQDWQQLLGNAFNRMPSPSPKRTKKKAKKSFSLFLGPVFRLIHTREWIRHMSMQFFWSFRKELQAQMQKRMGADFDCWSYRPEDLQLLLKGQKSVFEIAPYPTPSGWDMNTFLANRLDRRLPILVSGKDAQRQTGIGIYPGLVKGQVWRVKNADFNNLQVPPYEKVILVADALDPGWIPFFSEVDAVVSYVGGLLSHASIILREAAIPSITQIPEHLDLQEGDWIEMDAKSGKIKLLD